MGVNRVHKMLHLGVGSGAGSGVRIRIKYLSVYLDRQYIEHMYVGSREIIYK